MRVLVRLQGVLRDERGDVPGWVLITLMTVSLVAGITVIAGSQLNRMLSDALSSVSR